MDGKTAHSHSSTPITDRLSLVSGGDGSLDGLNQEVDGECPGQKNFAQKLFDLLAIDEYDDIFHWLPSGEAFCVMDKNVFEKKVMTKHFPCAKFESFTRRMRRWGFHRIETMEQRSKGLIIYSCPNFRRNRPDLCKRMCDDRQFKKSKASSGGPGGKGGFKDAGELVGAGGLPIPNNGFYQNQLCYPSGVMPIALQPMVPYWGPSTVPNGVFVVGHPVLGNNAMSFANLPYHSTMAPTLTNTNQATFPQTVDTARISRLDAIRANIMHIDAELATISRMKDLKQKSLSLAAAKSGQKDGENSVVKRDEEEEKEEKNPPAKSVWEV